MTDDPLISVIIPAYNAEKTLERACRSVWGQSYPNVELVVVDDGSIDGTGALLDALAAEHAGLRVLQQKNGGVSRARNVGLDAAGGELITFLDADDELIPDALATFYRAMVETDCDIVAGCCLRVRPDGTGFESRFPFEEDRLIWRGMEPLEQSLKDHPATYGVWSKLYRREVIGDVRFIEGRKLHEDSFFLFQVLCRDVTMVVTNCPAVRYYLTENSASRGEFSEKFLDMLYFAREKEEIIKECYPQWGDLAINVRIKACLALLNKMRLGCPKEFRPVRKECLRYVRENARYFIPVLPVDRVTFWAVRLHLFWLYSLVYRVLKGRK